MTKPAALACLALAASLSACTVADYYPNAELVEIDGRAFYVDPRPQIGPGVYMAGPNEPGMNEALAGDLVLNVNLPVANVRAIEAATGCKVRPESVRAMGGNTLAAVAC